LLTGGKFDLVFLQEVGDHEDGAHESIRVPPSKPTAGSKPVLTTPTIQLPATSQPVSSQPPHQRALPCPKELLRDLAFDTGYRLSIDAAYAVFSRWHREPGRIA